MTEPTSVDEFLPTNKDDPILIQLRPLFVASFYQHYKTVESQLNLPVGKSLSSWLEQVFDEEMADLLSQQCRCFVLYTPLSVIAGFLTVTNSKTETHGIYISQLAIDPRLKRQGYGLLLLKHLTSVYPSARFFTCLCRRVNQPALGFYEKYGAKLIDDRLVASQYGYNPLDYLGLQLTGDQLRSQ